MQDPAVIYQDNLDAVSAAIQSGDAGRCADRFCLPILMRYDGGEVLLEREEDLKADLERHARHLRGLNVTDYIRLVKKAAYLSEDMIEGWHETYILRNGQLAVPSYRSRILLRLDADMWRIAEAEHELAGARFVNGLVDPRPGSFAEYWKTSYDGIRTTHARAEPIYQAVLDLMSAHTMSGDFEAWSRQFTYPHQIHYDETDHVAQTPGDVRGFFDIVSHQIIERGADAMPRRAKRAEFIAGDRIVGYHDTLLTRQGEAVFGPVQSRMMLELQSDGVWLCMSVTNSLSSQNPSDTYTLSTTLPTMREIQERMKNG